MTTNDHREQESRDALLEWLAEQAFRSTARTPLDRPTLNGRRLLAEWRAARKARSQE